MVHIAELYAARSRDHLVEVKTVKLEVGKKREMKEFIESISGDLTDASKRNLLTSQ